MGRVMEAVRRPQLSLLSIFIILAAAAVILRVRLYMGPDLGWDDLLVNAILAPFVVLQLWVIFGAPRKARIFAVGFSLGAFAELFSVAHRLGPEVQSPPG
jgi:hypothetical protein